MPRTPHTCPGPDCTVQVDVVRLMCPAHWKQVPGPLRREVYESWDYGRGAGSSRHRRAVRAAVEAVSP